MPPYLERVATLPCEYQYSKVDVIFSQDTVSTRLRCAEIFNDRFEANFLLSEQWKNNTENGQYLMTLRKKNFVAYFWTILCMSLVTDVIDIAYYANICLQKALCMLVITHYYYD